MLKSILVYFKKLSRKSINMKDIWSIGSDFSFSLMFESISPIVGPLIPYFRLCVPSAMGLKPMRVPHRMLNICTACVVGNCGRLRLLTRSQLTDHSVTIKRNTPKKTGNRIIMCNDFLLIWPWPNDLGTQPHDGTEFTCKQKWSS